MRMQEVKPILDGSKPNTYKKPIDCFYEGKKQLKEILGEEGFRKMFFSDDK